MFKGQAEEEVAGAGEYLDSVAVMRSQAEDARKPTRWEKITRDRIYRQVPKLGQDPATAPILTIPEVPLGSILNRVRVRFECEFKYGDRPTDDTRGVASQVMKDDDLSTCFWLYKQRAEQAQGRLEADMDSGIDGVDSDTGTSKR